MWYEGPEWLLNKDNWPEDIVTKRTSDSMCEINLTKSVFAKVAIDEKGDSFFPLLANDANVHTI